MKVTVNKYLNVRVGAPSVNAPCYQYLAPGSELIVDGRLYKGDEYDSIDTWLKDEASNYYWSGGFENNLKKAEPAEIQKPFLQIIDYGALVKNLSPQAIANAGQGIKVAILDTGIFEGHPDLADAFSNTDSCDFTRSKFLHDDVQGHGSHIAGLIGARANGASGICGIAKKCTLQNLKVITDKGDSIGKNVRNGLVYLNQNSVTKPVDIVNLSLDVTVTEYNDLIPELTILTTNSVVVAAAGENERVLQSKGPLCPAFFSETISVGVIDETFLRNHLNPIFHKRVDYLMPFRMLSSCGNRKIKYDEMEGSSMATALVSGIVALILSLHGKSGRGNTTFIKNELNKIATPFSPQLDLNILQLIKP